MHAILCTYARRRFFVLKLTPSDNYRSFTNTFFSTASCSRFLLAEVSRGNRKKKKVQSRK